MPLIRDQKDVIFENKLESWFEALWASEGWATI